jgi:hypothetical protein
VVCHRAQRVTRCARLYHQPAAERQLKTRIFTAKSKKLNKFLLPFFASPPLPIFDLASPLGVVSRLRRVSSKAPALQSQAAGHHSFILSVQPE